MTSFGFLFPYFVHETDFLSFFLQREFLRDWKRGELTSTVWANKWQEECTGTFRCSFSCCCERPTDTALGILQDTLRLPPWRCDVRCCRILTGRACRSALTQRAPSPGNKRFNYPLIWYCVFCLLSRQKAAPAAVQGQTGNHRPTAR